MTITKQRENTALTLTLAGRVDTGTAPQLEAEINGVQEEIDDLTIDMGEVAYLSSAGLRVILAAQKKMNRQGMMKIRHVNDTVMEVFAVTGFTDILTIEE